ncbi:Fe3+-siderophore ABC transporter permease [Lysinibacillus sp. 2017]|uniref:Fe3+-siderophore ABC transporter permease n=1 Tax=unclassified Lysinibacillus TaxID=2636778 RepID=UPI000D5277AB|nr:MULTISPECIES: Fe3+-siderophore ABC transporter permease [unclassified Lysinibacillus]AWE07807.1 Fe3+-siderophore ABC transporter permease [Lysinibacillus sp. 2017]TGN34628.1 Fe3+-siderophore ABC transporter permease [Lysinibacillus sp. S2017]
MIQVLFVILLWVIPIILVTNTYFKMDKEERQKLKTEFKSPLTFLCVGLLIIGFLLSLSGIILAIGLLQHIGVTMVFTSWFTTSIVNWKKGKTNFIKSAVLILLGVLGIAAYGFMVT